MKIRVTTDSPLSGLNQTVREANTDKYSFDAKLTRLLLGGVNAIAVHYGSYDFFYEWEEIHTQFKKGRHEAM